MSASTPPHKRTIIDAFAGVGNNSIAFASAAEPSDPDAFRWDRVIAIERDAATLACAQHNAGLYGAEVASRITWVNGDSFEYLARLRRFHQGQADSGKSQGQGQEEELSEDLRLDIANTVIFASPPWGGPGYVTDEVFDLSGMEPYNLAQLHEAYKLMDHALFLPRTSNLRQIARLVPDDDGGSATTGDDSADAEGKEKKKKKIDVAQYCVQGASKALVAYIPASAGSTPDEGATT